MRLPPFKLERFFAKYEFKAPHLLCSSDCESMSIGDLLAFEPDAAEAFQAQWLGYTESLGDPELRAAISALYEQIDPDQILVHAGAEEAIFNFMQVALAPGDHVIVHMPCYQSLLEVPRALGCHVTPWEAVEARGWALDFEALRQTIRPNTRAIVVNCPHNPTGYLMSHAEQQELVDIARQHNLLLFFDEVYRGLEYDPADRLPAACDRYENAVSLGVMSKTYGLAGLRIGWIATQNREVYQAMAAAKDYTTICNSAPSEFLATLALRHHEKLARRNRQIVMDNLSLLDQFFGANGHLFQWQRPKAGPIAFPRLKQTNSAEAFCLDLIDKEGVLLLPATHFDWGDAHFRIGFGRKTMPAALDRLRAYVEQYLIDVG